METRANSVIVSSQELGSNCWMPGRFCPGVRCKRVYDCTYPERQTCKAVEAERQHLEQVQRQETTRYIEKLNALNAQVEGARRRLDKPAPHPSACMCQFCARPKPQEIPGH